MTNPSTRRLPWSGIAAVLLGATLAGAVGFLPASERRIGWFVEYGVPVLWITLLAALILGVVVAARALRAAPWRRVAESVFAAGALALALGAVVAPVPARMRILADEYLIAGTGLGIWAAAKPLVPTSGVEVGPMFRSLSQFIDKRGLTVPALGATLHLVRGYRLEHGYWINLAAAWATLVAMFVLVREGTDAGAALAAGLLLLAVPPFDWAVRSQALESVNLFLIVASATIALSLARRPDARLALLLAALGPLLAQARYESSLFALLGFGLAAVALWRARSGVGPWLGLALVPFGYLPLAWQRAIPFGFEMQTIGADHAFGLDYLAGNGAHAARLLAHPGPLLPAAPLLLVLAVLALALGTPSWRAAMRRRDPRAWTLAALAACAAAVELLVLAFAWGDLEDPATLRLGLPLFAVLAGLAALALHGLRERFRVPIALPLAGAVLVASLGPIRAEAGYDAMLAGPGMNAAAAIVHDAFPGCRVLFVTEYPGYFTAQRVSAVSPTEAEQQWPQIRSLAQAAGLDGAIAIQIANRAAGLPLPGNRLPEGFATRVLAEEEAGPSVLVRLVAVDRADAPLGATHSGACTLGVVPGAGG